MLIFLAALTLCCWVALAPMLLTDPSRGRVMAATPTFPEVPVVTFDSRGFC